jgi:hypothetical protein
MVIGCSAVKVPNFSANSGEFSSDAYFFYCIMADVESVKRELQRLYLAIVPYRMPMHRGRRQ